MSSLCHRAKVAAAEVTAAKALDAQHAGARSALQASAGAAFALHDALTDAWDALFVANFIPLNVLL